MYPAAIPRPPHRLPALFTVMVLLAALSGCRQQATAPAVASVPATSAPAAVAAATSPAGGSAQASAALMALPELKAWASAIDSKSGGSVHGAVIEYDASPRLVEGKAYHQLSFVENGKDAVHRWQDFLVAEDGSILVDDGASGKTISLAQWRASSHPLARQP